MSGLLHTAAEVTIWQDRAINGPYKTTGDKYAYSPGAWDDVVVKADLMYNDNLPFPDFWDDADITQGSATVPYTNQIGHYTMATAFYYLIKGDSGYGSVAKTAILAQIRNTNPVFEDYYTLPANDAFDLFHFAGVAMRFLMAFEYTKDLFSESEITEVETWMGRAYPMFLQFGEYYPKSNYINRLSRDYSVLGNYALSGQQLYGDTDPRSWTHKDSGGTFQNRLYRIHTDYNNQTAISMLFCGLWAVYTNDSAKIDRVKIFFEEFLRFACFPDGTIGEYFRNNVSFPQLGTQWYSVITLECYALFADALRRTGDNSMYTHTTSDGLWGNDGGSKNLKLLLDTLVSNITQSIVRYYDTVTDLNKLDVLGGSTYRYKPEMIFGIANKYYNDNDYKNTYLLNNSTVDYSSTSGPQYLTDAKWSNNAGILPAVPMMYNGMEAYPNIGSKSYGVQALLI